MKAVRFRGLSLLELLVAVAIMALALGALYRAAGGSVRVAGDAARYRDAVRLAETLIQANADLPESGWNEEGESGGFLWTIHSRSFTTAVNQGAVEAVPLHELRVSVRWLGHLTAGDRAVDLVTLLPQRRRLPLEERR